MSAEAPPQTTPWEDALLAATLFAVDPHGLGGILVRARPGPARDEWLTILREMLPADMPVRRVPLNVSPARLVGGLDLAATLREGRPVQDAGILHESAGGVLILPMAERISAGTAALICQGLERHASDGKAQKFALIAFDEGIDDEMPPPTLVDRMAFILDLDGIPVADFFAPTALPAEIAAARQTLDQIVVTEEARQLLAEVSLAVGIRSMRPVLMALRAATAHAAISERTEVTAEDVIDAARLIMGPRATVLPQSPAEQEATPPPPPPPEPEDAEAPSSDPTPEEVLQALQDVVLAAVQASIPSDLLARLRDRGQTRSREQSLGRAGTLRASKLRGRPVGVRPGDPSRGERLNIVETLRAAAPWQRLRRADPKTSNVLVRKEDFRTTRYKNRSESITVFVVDASGSAAMNRLAEVKGAVELMLAESYARRDQVALITFRNLAAEMALPPTRSLVRAKRCLAGLPGGGGTPLAAGLNMARELTENCQRKGQSPVIVVLTDGRANVSRAGVGGRKQAEEDAVAAARALRGARLQTVLVDTSPRPQADAQTLAREMDALYLPLPHVNAEALSDAVAAVSGNRRG